jgi:hypothetical protein
MIRDKGMQKPNVDPILFMGGFFARKSRKQKRKMSELSIVSPEFTPDKPYKP